MSHLVSALRRHIMTAILPENTTEQYNSTSAPAARGRPRSASHAADVESPGTVKREQYTDAIADAQRWKVRAVDAVKDKRQYAADIEKLQKQLEEMQRDMECAQKDLSGLQGALRTSQEDLRRERLAAGEVNRTLKTLRKEHCDTVALLDARTAELHDAQKYLTKTDALSDAEVVHMFKNLNSQIFQIAAQMADTLPFVHTRGEKQEWAIKARTGVEELVGRRTALLLQEYPHYEDPICVQIALQACIISFTSWVIATWNFKAETDRVLWECVYSQVKEKETQSVSGRWRALTRFHLRSLWRETDILSALEQHLTGHITDVLLVSGMNHSPTQIYDATRDQYGEKLRCILQSSLELQRCTGERIVASDVAAITVTSGGDFHPDEMEDAYPTDKTNHTSDRRGIGILCTTEMGCRRVERQGKEGEIHVVTLLKPKVALETMVQELEAVRTKPLVPS